MYFRLCQPQIESIKLFTVTGICRLTFLLKHVKTQKAIIKFSLRWNFLKFSCIIQKKPKVKVKLFVFFCVFSWLLDFFKTLDSQTHRENQIYFEVKVGPKKLIIDLSTGSRDYEKAIEQMKSLGFLPLGVSLPCTCIWVFLSLPWAQLPTSN